MLRVLFALLLSLSIVTVSSADPCLPDTLHRGDVNCSGGEPNMTDVIVLLNVLNGGPAPACFFLADVNGSGTFNEQDVEDLILYLFGGCGVCMAQPHCIEV